jgi:hypothetical protein
MPHAIRHCKTYNENNFMPLQHASFAALSLMLQMVQLGEMQHLCSVKGVTPLGVPHLLQMLHRADAVLRCAFVDQIQKMHSVHDASCCMV